MVITVASSLPFGHESARKGLTDLNTRTLLVNRQKETTQKHVALLGATCIPCDIYSAGYYKFRAQSAFTLG